MNTMYPGKKQRREACGGVVELAGNNMHGMARRWRQWACVSVGGVFYNYYYRNPVHHHAIMTPREA